MDNEDLVGAALAYTSRDALEVRELLGSGIHGIVYVVESKTVPGRRAVKLHRDSDAYLREKMVYERLSEKRVDSILGFQVPVPLRFDDEFMARGLSSREWTPRTPLTAYRSTRLKLIA